MSDSTTDSHKNISKISQDDYFNKSSEFRHWLKRKYHIYFDELKSSEQREYFDKFIKKWNSKELDEKYYKGKYSSEITSRSNTRYQWNFAKNINEGELDRVKSLVQNETNSISKDKRDRPNEQKQDTNIYKSEQLDSTYESNRSKRREDKRLKKHHEMVMEELAPKPVGREAAIEKKKVMNAYHKKEPSPEVEINDNELMGESDTFQKALIDEKRRNAKRERVKAEKMEQVQSKAAKYQAQEDESMNMFRELAKQRNRLL